MFFEGTDTNLMEEREFLLDARFTELNVAPSYARYTCYGVLYERRYRYQLLDTEILLLLATCNSKSKKCKALPYYN